MRCLPEPRYPSRIGSFRPRCGGRFLIPNPDINMVHATVIAILAPLAVFLWLHAPRLHTGGYTWITVLVVGFAAACVPASGGGPAAAHTPGALCSALLLLAVTLATEPGIIPPLVYRIRYLTGRSRRFRDGDGAGSSRGTPASPVGSARP